MKRGAPANSTFPRGTPASGLVAGSAQTWEQLGQLATWGISDALAASVRENLAHVVGHELLHFLGVAHSGEDLLDDTPACEAPLALGPEERALCADYDNLMFPTAGGGALLSVQQAALARLHPAMRPGECGAPEGDGHPAACGPSCVDCTGLPGVDGSAVRCVDGICRVECSPGWEDRDGTWLTGCEHQG